MIDAERLRKMFYLFGVILPLRKDEMANEGFKAVFGESLDELVPLTMKILCEEMIKNPDSAESYLDFLVEAILYAKGETDELPQIDGKTSEELEIILQHR